MLFLVVFYLYSAGSGTLKKPTGAILIRRQQIAAARALLSWSRQDLSDRSGVSLRTIARFEGGEGDITTSKLDRLETSLAQEGIEFIDGGVTLQGLKSRFGAGLR
ncbi:MAG: helix-turn-helix transcriptional regulator [Pseudomonadota bacterium]